MEMLTVIVDRNSRVSNHIIGYPKEGKKCWREGNRPVNQEFSRSKERSVYFT